MKQLLKRSVLASHAGRRVYGELQQAWFERDYRARRERYQRLTEGDLAATSSQAALQRALQKVEARGHSIQPRAQGALHVFAFLPSSWPHQDQIARGLAPLGTVKRFDYVREGFALPALRSATPGSEALRSKLQGQLLAEVRRTQRERPIDVFFAYALGWDLTADSLRTVQDEIGCPTINLSLDDKNWWDEIERGDHASGLRRIAPHFDLGCTSARVVLPWYWAEGGAGYFLPEGVNTDWFCPMPEVAQDLDIGFVGNNFGWRPELLATLRRAGLRVEAHGTGWEGGSLPESDMVRFFNRCRINLGLGDMHYSRWLTNLKGRDFEVPATGRGVYLTTYNSELAECFEVSHEIACYRGVDEMIELVRRLLARGEEAAAMAARARERCVREHRWEQRLGSVLRALGVLTPA